MPEQTWPVTTENSTMSDKELRNLTYKDSAGNVRPFPAYGRGAGVVQKSDGTIVDPIAYDKDINIGFTNPNLHRRIDIHDPETEVNPNLLSSAPLNYMPTEYCAYQLALINNMIAGQKYTVQFWGVDISNSGKTSDQLGLSIYWGGALNDECDFTVEGGHADYLVKTFIAQNNDSVSDSNNLWLNIYNSTPYVSGEYNLSIKYWKLEQGEIATPLDREYEPREYSLEIHGTNSYRTTTITVHDEDSTTSEIP